MLQAFVRQMQQYLPDADLLSRYGGDEFVVLLPHLDNADNIQSLCRELINQDELTRVDGLPELVLRLSIGVSFSPDDAVDPHDLLQHAQTAMMAVKTQRSHGFRFFTAATNERSAPLRRPCARRCRRTS